MRILKSAPLFSKELDVIESALALAEPEELNLCPRRWSLVLQSAAEFCERGLLPAVSLQVQRHGRTTGVHSFGSRRLNEFQPVDSDTLFLIASLTKPMVAMLAVKLVEQGRLGLNQRVVDFFPKMHGSGKRAMTIRHLLTHTSGLPDMLPNNRELREAQSGLQAFIDGTLLVELNQPVGRAAQYQSMGYALLGGIIEQITGESCRQALQREIFEPLGMKRSWLGLPPEMRGETNIAEIRVPEDQKSGPTWNWNSVYWRELGAPWGGVVATTGDVSKFLATMLGTLPLFSPSAIDDAVGNRLVELPQITEQERRTRGWGLGWRLNWKDHRHSLSELLPAEVCGHWGATGCLFWLDRSSGVGLTILSSQPVGDQDSPLSKLSNLVAAAIR